MRASCWRRFGVMMVVVLLLGAVLVPAAAASDGSIIHVVRSGETLFGIANRYGVSMYRIAEANHLTNLNAIYVGQRLVIPIGGSTWSCPTYYRVVRGDNLTRIASRYGVTVWQLQQWNHISNPNRIYVGQSLVIYPRSCTPPRPAPVPTPSPAGTWLAQYYNNRDLSGSPVLERREANLTHNWGFGSPAPAQVFADDFSARWTRSFNMAGGTYRITARVDDGVRLYIDGVLVIDAWVVQPVTTYQVDVIIAGGNRTFSVEYFEAEGLSEITITSTKL